jgi:hypothetical protein
MSSFVCGQGRILGRRGGREEQVCRQPITTRPINRGSRQYHCEFDWPGEMQPLGVELSLQTSRVVALHPDHVRACECAPRDGEDAATERDDFADRTVDRDRNGENPIRTSGAPAVLTALRLDGRGCSWPGRSASPPLPADAQDLRRRRDLACGAAAREPQDQTNRRHCREPPRGRSRSRLVRRPCPSDRSYPFDLQANRPLGRDGLAWAGSRMGKPGSLDTMLGYSLGVFLRDSQVAAPGGEPPATREE